ncbi:MAG: 2Fe-2S iron-sulfur cluster-binding protein [Fidelibacterota bacterium]
MIKLTINGKKIESRAGLTLLDVFRQNGIRVPTLCHHEAVSPYAACRLCLVEVTAGPRKMLTASCMYPAADGIIVETESKRALTARRLVAELLLARCPDIPEVQRIAVELGVNETRFPQRNETCVLCGLCVRGCREIAGVGVLDFANRGAFAEVVTPFDLPSEMCVGCTTCVYLCPTDTIQLSEIRRLEAPHAFNGNGKEIKCILCGQYQIDHQFQRVADTLIR